MPYAIHKTKSNFDSITWESKSRLPLVCMCILYFGDVRTNEQENKKMCAPSNSMHFH